MNTLKTSFFLFILSTALSTSLFASDFDDTRNYHQQCGQDFHDLVDRDQSTKVLSSTIEILYDQTQDLTTSEKVAYDEYLKTNSFLPSNVSDLVIQIKTYEYVSNSDLSLLGLRIDVETHDDESRIRFYMQQTNDGVSLLNSYWDNQTPIRTWICD